MTMKRTALVALTVLTAALGVQASAQDTAREKNLTIIRTLPWGAQNFNPLTANDQHLAPTLSAIYESLFFVNALNGKVTDVLGTKYNWSKDNKTLTMTTRSGVKWSDGRPFNAGDVAFTFNYIKKFPALANIWKSGLTSVKAKNDSTVVFTFDKVNTPVFTFVAGQAILPEHIWSKIADPTTAPNAQPVGTGPFVFDSYSQQALRVKKNPNYWMKGQPYIEGIIWLPTNGNDAALLKMLKAEGDWSYIGLSDPKNDFVSKGPNNGYWWPVNSTNYLYFNTAKAPFSDAAFRRSISQAINTDDVAQKAYAGVLKAAHPSGVIPSQRSTWYPNAPQNLMRKFNPAAADAALTKAGYRKDAQGKRLGKDGKPLPSFKILVGAGWTDYITMAQVISENLKKVGISTQIDQQAFSGYAAGFQTGTYDMGVSWAWGTGPTPYYLFYQSFSPDTSAPVGQNAASNLTRYTHPAITQALAQFRSTNDAALQKKAIATIATQVMRDAPWLPLTDRSQFDVFNTTYFTNFPTTQNPYNDGIVDDQPGARLMFLNVKPKTK